MGLFAASVIGYVFANHAFVSGTAGGCQAEVGSAAAMAAGTVTELRGGSPEAAAQRVTKPNEPPAWSHTQEALFWCGKWNDSLNMKSFTNGVACSSTWKPSRSPKRAGQ